ncbi:hypothetical protein F5Y16DRAFT_394275 [Xylariaceae sp. FL0255]|nr:hypothetical protein F5Y16DRAFT_394275 [Xylariaceae sp. FL0255]
MSDPYSAAMNGQQRYQLEDPSPPQHRRSNSRFDSHNDFYNFLDNNRGPPAMANGGDSQQQQQQQQQPQPQQNYQHRIPQSTTQSRPPVTNSFPDRSRHSWQSGSRSDEHLGDKATGPVNARGPRQNPRPPSLAKPTGSGSRPPPARGGSPTPPVSGGSSPTRAQQLQGGRPLSASATADVDAAAASIQRLKSPSVLDHVLKPLDQKIREYEQLMQREQNEMKRLDEELRILQAQRADADARFTEAKLKHDEYRRQYTDVERAMAGELPISRPATMHTAPNTTQQHSPATTQRRHSVRIDDEYDDVDDMDHDDMSPTFGPRRRINSQQSFSRASLKASAKERFRFSSLFGGNR